MNVFRPTELEGRLADVGAVLAERDEQIEIVVVGGAAMLLRGEAVRLTTGDVDVLAAVDDAHLVFPYPLPEPLAEAVREVAESYGLSDDWMNATVASNWSHRWPEGLPYDLLGDVERRTYGGLTVALAGRSVLIPLKVHAVVDRARAVAFDAAGLVTAVDLSPTEAVRHLGDLVALAPSDGELAAARRWVGDQDTSPHLSAFLDAIERHVLAARR